jgi:hypothetical protein
MNEQHETTLIAKCVFTGVYYSVTAKTSDWRRYENGDGNIQDIFPYLSAEDREFIKSRISPLGWQSVFADR